MQINLLSRRPLFQGNDSRGPKGQQPQHSLIKIRQISLLKKEVNGMKNRVGSNLPLMEMLSYSDVILLDVRRSELYRTNKNGELGAGPKAPWKSTASNQGSHWGMALSASFKIITSNVRKVLETESKLHAQNLPVEFLPGGLGPIARNI